MTHESPRPRPSPGMLSALMVLGLMLLTGVVFGPVLTAGFVNDSDREYVPNQSWLWSGEWDWRPVRQFFHRSWVYHPAESGGYYQPLTALSLRMDGWLTRVTSSRLDSNSAAGWYARAFQFHLTNLLLHVGCVALVFLIARRLKASRLWAFLLAGLFAFYPTQVESVAWISQRMTLLGGLFSLFATLTYLRGRNSRAGWAWMTVTTFFYAASLLSRPLFMGLPVVFLLLDLWPLKRTGWRPFLEKMPLFVVMGFVGVLQFVARAGAALPREGGVGVQSVMHGFASLVARLFWPFGLGPYQPSDTTVGGAALGSAFDIFVILLLLALATVSFRRSKPWFFSIVGAGLLIVPSVLEAPYSKLLLSDQYLYLGLLAPILAAAAWIGTRPDHLRGVRGRWCAILAGCVVAAAGAQSYAQSMHWRSAVTLGQWTISLHPDWSYGMIDLVEAYIQENALDSALHAARRAVNDDSENATAQFYLGTVLLLDESSHASDAIEPLRRALASNPDWIECLQNLGVALARSGRSDEAIGYLERARTLEPNSAEIRLGLGNAYLEVRRYASARGEFQESLRLDNGPMAQLGLAIAWAANDEVDHARRHLAAAVAKNPAFAERAGRSSVLLKLRNSPGFDGLIESPADGHSAPPSAIVSPAAVRAHGS